MGPALETRHGGKWVGCEDHPVWQKGLAAACCTLLHEGCKLTVEVCQSWKPLVWMLLQ